jgi:hypothetical protein
VTHGRRSWNLTATLISSIADAGQCGLRDRSAEERCAAAGSHRPCKVPGGPAASHRCPARHPQAGQAGECAARAVRRRGSRLTHACGRRVVLGCIHERLESRADRIACAVRFRRFRAAGCRAAAPALLCRRRRRWHLHACGGAHVYRAADAEPADPPAGGDGGHAPVPAPPRGRTADRSGHGAAGGVPRRLVADRSWREPDPAGGGHRAAAPAVRRASGSAGDADG